MSRLDDTSYLDDPNHQWTLEPAAMDDPGAVLYELLTRLSAAAEQRFADPEDFTETLSLHHPPPYSRVLHALLFPPEGTRQMEAFNALLATLDLPPVPVRRAQAGDPAEAGDLILRGAQGLYLRGAGTPAQCIDTSMIWYYG